MPKSKYQGNDGTIHAITMSADRLAKAGAPPAGAVDSPINAKISKSNREYGIRPRGVIISRPVNPTAEQKIHRSFLPVLTQTALDAAAFSPTTQITIGTQAWVVDKRVPEDY